MTRREPAPAAVVIDGAHDAWHWVVAYDDGTGLAQYDADGTEHGWDEVETHRLAAVALVPQREGLAPVSIPVQPGMDVFFKRVGGAALHQDAAATPVRLHLLGWKTPAAQTVLTLFEDGSQLLSDRELF